MIDSKGNVRPEGMFNRAHLAPEAQRAYDALLECVLNGQKGCEVSARAGMDTIKRSYSFTLSDVTHRTACAAPGYIASECFSSWR